MGKTYLAMYDPHHTNSALDNFKLPRNLLLDTATQDLGPHFARRLLNMREYLHEHHPMARQLMPIDEVPGVRLNFDSYLRMEAHSTHTGKMEPQRRPRSRAGRLPPSPCGKFEDKMMKAKTAAKEAKECLRPCGQFFQADLWIQDQKHKEARKFYRYFFSTLRA